MPSKDATDSRLTLATISASTNNTELSFNPHSKWCPRTRKEKVLCALFLMFLIMTVALLTALIIVLQKYAVLDQPRRICESKSCIEAASALLFNMDTSQDPCNDFYDYACGGFTKQVSIPEDQPAVNTFQSIALEIQTKMRSLFQDPVHEDEPSFFKIAKNLYESCVNADIIEDLDDKPLKDILNAVGGWPVVVGKDWDESVFVWQKVISKFRDVGVYMNFLLDVAVVQDLKNSSRFILQLDQPYFGMPDRSYLLKGTNDTLVLAYYTFMTETAVMLGADKDAAKEELMKVLEFEIELAKFALPLEEQRNFTKMYNKMTIEQLQENIPEIDWLDYISGLSFPTEITKTEEIIVITPSYIKNFAKTLAKTEKRLIANYLMWRAAKSLIDMLSRRFRLLQLQYTSILTGQSAEVARPYYCTDVVFENLDVAVGAMYIRTHFTSESKPVAASLVKEVREAFYKNLDNIDWLDEDTLSKAKDKAKAMSEHIAFPEELTDDKKITSFYKNLTIQKDKYFANILTLNKFSTNFFLSRLKQGNDSNWVTSATAAVVNAYYKFSDNSMQFFAAILNGAFFDPQRPKYMNFGSMGFIVAHEITHGFDDMGRQYDQHGNLDNWWSKETDKKFREKSDCIINLYGNYTVPEINKLVNGIITQGENIADVGGVKQAYKAYLNWEKREGPELPLPGLNFTPRQLFWLSNANVWCSKERLAYLDLDINTNPHSPSRFRVNGPLSNSVEFAQDFSCPLGSPMNPQNKCTIW